MLVPETRAAVLAGAAAELAEVVLDGVLGEDVRRVDRPHRQCSRQKHRKQGLFQHQLRERPRHPAHHLAPARIGEVLEGPVPLLQGDQRRHQRVGGDPAEQHPEKAHERELVEAAEADRAQRAVAGRRRRAGCEGRQPGRPQRHRKRHVHRRAAPPLLDVAGEQDDPGVDAVADDDAAEKSGVRIQVMDHRAREGEGDRHAGEERQNQKRHGADGPVIEHQRQPHRDQHQRARDHQIPHQRFLRLDHGADLPAVADLDAGVKALWIQGLHHVVHGVEDVLVLLQPDRRAGRRDEHHQRMAVLACQVAVGEAIEARIGRLDTAEHFVQIRWRRRGLGLFGDVDQQRIRLGYPLLERIAGLLDVFEIGIERAVLVEEVLLRLDLPVHPRDQGRRQAHQPPRQRVDELFAGLEIVGPHHHGEVREAADALLQLLQTHRCRRPLRQQLAQVGAQVAVEPYCRGNTEEKGDCAQQHQEPRPPQRERAPPLPELVDARLHPAPCLGATASIDSRSSESPLSAVSRSMVSAGCRRMAWV